MHVRETLTTAISYRRLSCLRGSVRFSRLDTLGGSFRLRRHFQTMHVKKLIRNFPTAVDPTAMPTIAPELKPALCSELEEDAVLIAALANLLEA